MQGQAVWGKIVTLACIAASVRADAGASRRISVGGLSPDDTELVTLMFEILGWQVAHACPADGEDAADGALLAMRLVDGVVRVATVDRGLAPRLAATGLDRLVTPLNLAALEHLGVLAG
jgi:hypothetical protein